MKILIIDDDLQWLEPARDIVSKYFAEKGQQHEICCCSSITDIREQDEQQLDLAFVDIKLMDGDGISYAHHLNLVNKHCRIIYVTNYLNYAPDVYETEHVYFVLKEQFEKRLPDVMEKAAKMWDMGAALIDLHLVHGDRVLLRADEIISCERRLRKSYVSTVRGIYEVNDKLDDLQDRLPYPMFVRCHNSYIVSMEQVSVMEAIQFQLKNGMHIPISRRHASGVRKQFMEWSAMQRG